MQLLYVFKTHWFISNITDLIHLQTTQMIQIHLLNTCINYDWSKVGSEGSAWTNGNSKSLPR